MILLTLYWAFFQVGIFAFGGGLAALPLIRDQVVVLHGWLDMAAFTDLVTIAEMTPGPIALNAATFVGTKVAGLPGAIIATMGVVTPSLLIVLVLARIYQRWKDKPAFRGVLSGLRPAAVALIASAGVSIAILALFGEGKAIALEHIDWVSFGTFALALFVLRKWKPSPIFIIFAAGVVGAAAKLLLNIPAT